MEKEIFNKILSLKSEVDDYIEQAEDILKIDIFDTKPVDNFYLLFDLVFKNEYTIEGFDWICWFVFEKRGRKEMKAYDNDVEILKNVEELYEYVEKNYKIKSKINK